MNTSARRDGTPDRRKRSDQPASGGANRNTGSRGARAAQRGAAAERGAWDNDQRGNGRRGGSHSDSPQRGTGRGGYGQGDSAQRGTGRGGYGQGDSAQRGTGRGGYGQGDSAQRGTGRGGYSQGDSAQRGGRGGYSQGDSAQRGTGRGGYGDAPQRGAYGQGGTASGGSGGRGPSATPQSGSAPRGARRPAQAQAPAGRKAKNPKPQRQVSGPPLLSNAKPARRQHVETDSTETHTKMPWGEGERLQKVLAKAGVASRRAAEDLIDQGRVEVDGLIVREQGLRIDPQNAVVRVDGTRVMVRAELVHLALNKPKGWQSTMSDDLGRPCVGDIVAERIAAGQRLFHVGRLDADTEGLLLLTNDGDLAHRLMHPSFEVSKTYLATVNGEVNNKVISKRLRDGVELEDGPAKVDRFQVLEIGEGRSLVKLVLHEGRKHIVRRLLDEVGHPVTRLVRTHIGPVLLGDQRPGTLRVLGRDEVGKLYEAVSL
ncbi:pseudouridine synthase [Nocardia aurea]|uniref:pseudouridine synthase n=1 Tax=Nocardia aurea TaxID=2144174 RepID=UPI0033AB415F